MFSLGWLETAVAHRPPVGLPRRSRHANVEKDHASADSVAVGGAPCGFHASGGGHAHAIRAGPGAGGPPAGAAGGGGAGRGRALVVGDEAGVGKSALLEYAAAAAPDLRLVRAVGVESEMELAFAGLHQLCAPLLDRLEWLAPPQRDALGIAFGLRSG